MVDSTTLLNSTSLLPSLCMSNTRLDFTNHRPVRFTAPPKYRTPRSDDQSIFIESIVTSLKSNTGAKSSRQKGTPEVFVLDQNELRHPFLVPDSLAPFTNHPLPQSFRHFEYADVWKNLSDVLVGTLYPFVAVHWRTETLPASVLVPCGISLTKKLAELKALHSSLRSVYVSTDYPLDLLQQGNGGEAPSAHSTTYTKFLTAEHHAAMRKFLAYFKKADTGLLLTSFASEEQLVKLPPSVIALLPPDGAGVKRVDRRLRSLDSAPVGIVDKLVSSRAEVFLAGRSGYQSGELVAGACGKVSSFTDQIVEVREGVWKEGRRQEKGGGKLWNTPAIARCSDRFGRLEMILVSLLLYIVGENLPLTRAPHYGSFSSLPIIGTIVQSTSSSVGAFAGGAVLYQLGYTGLQLMVEVLIADTTSLRSRLVFSFVAVSPFLINTWVSGTIAQAVLASAGWKWGIGMWGIIMPAASIPLLYVLFVTRHELSIYALEPDAPAPVKSERHPLLRVVDFADEMDFIGLILLLAACCLVLIPLTIAGGVQSEWKRPYIIVMLVVGACCIPAFLVWEMKLSRFPLVPKEHLHSRTILGSIGVGIFLNAWWVQGNYLYTVMYVSFGQSITTSTRIANLYSFVATLSGIGCGIFVRFVGRVKALMIFGVTLFAVGFGLVIRYRGGPSNYSGMLGAQILLGMAGGFFTYPAQVSIQAAVPHESLRQDESTNIQSITKTSSSPRFTPKDDIASSTSIKSSIQRHIRSALLAQLPFLSLPANPAPKPVRTGDDSDDSDSEAEVVLTKKEKKGAGPSKGGKGKGGGKGRGKEEAEEEKVDEGKDEGGLTVLDVIWPKKEGLTLVKCREHISILVLHGEPLFFQHFDGPYYPTLKLLHKYRGAIKFVLAGANIMWFVLLSFEPSFSSVANSFFDLPCRTAVNLSLLISSFFRSPGLTSPTAALPKTNVPKTTPVAVHAYGKDLALGVGLTSMSTDEIRSINKGVGVENVAYLGDDLWSVTKL
ncbi:MFS transporter, SIT family, siderophore-iron:H+ symporter, partial [Phenoliferia sp. Uapishka_3]